MTNESRTSQLASRVTRELACAIAVTKAHHWLVVLLIIVIVIILVIVIIMTMEAGPGTREKLESRVTRELAWAIAVAKDHHWLVVLLITVIAIIVAVTIIIIIIIIIIMTMKAGPGMSQLEPRVSRELAWARIISGW